MTRARKSSTLTEENLATFSPSSGTRRSKRASSITSDDTASTVTSMSLRGRSTRRTPLKEPLTPKAVTPRATRLSKKFEKLENASESDHIENVAKSPALNVISEDPPKVTENVEDNVTENRPLAIIPEDVPKVTDNTNTTKSAEKTEEKIFSPTKVNENNGNDKKIISNKSEVSTELSIEHPTSTNQEVLTVEIEMPSNFLTEEIDKIKDDMLKKSNVSKHFDNESLENTHVVQNSSKVEIDFQQHKENEEVIHEEKEETSNKISSEKDNNSVEPMDEDNLTSLTKPEEMIPETPKKNESGVAVNENNVSNVSKQNEEAMDIDISLSSSKGEKSFIKSTEENEHEEITVEPTLSTSLKQTTLSDETNEDNRESKQNKSLHDETADLDISKQTASLLDSEKSAEDNSKLDSPPVIFTSPKLSQLNDKKVVSESPRTPIVNAKQNKKMSFENMSPNSIEFNKLKKSVQSSPLVKSVKSSPLVKSVQSSPLNKSVKSSPLDKSVQINVTDDENNKTASSKQDLNNLTAEVSDNKKKSVTILKTPKQTAENSAVKRMDTPYPDPKNTSNIEESQLSGSQKKGHSFSMWNGNFFIIFLYTTWNV